MPFRIRTSNIVIECDTALELDEAIRILQSPKEIESELQEENAKREWNKANYSKFLRLLDGRQKELVSSLLNSENGKTSQEIGVALGYEKKKQLAGTMAALSKNLKKLGFRIDDLIIKEVIGRGTEKIQRYKLNSEFLYISRSR